MSHFYNFTSAMTPRDTEHKFRALLQATSHVSDDTKYGYAHLNEHGGFQ